MTLAELGSREAIGRILVVDDHADARLLLTRILELHGHEVAQAEDGARALDIARCISPDVVVLDLVMPDMDGFEVCTRLRALAATATTPVIFLTAVDDPDVRAACLHIGAAEVLLKPVDYRDVLARVEAQLTDARRKRTED